MKREGGSLDGEIRARPAYRGRRLAPGRPVTVPAPQILTGLWALSAPRSFYDDYPLAGRAWISTLGPYNEHLVRDVGAGLLALGMLVALAAFLLERRLVQVSLGVWLYGVKKRAKRASTGRRARR
jgi:hypothetical protein